MSYGEAAAIMLGLSTFTFAYLSVNFKDRHAPLKWLFMLFSGYMTGFGAIVMSIVSKNAGYENVESMMSWIGYGVIIIMVFTTAYFLIWFIYNSLRKTSQKAYGEGSGP